MCLPAIPPLPPQLPPLPAPQYSGGVPWHALEGLGTFAAPPNASFYSFLRSLPKEQVRGPGRALFAEGVR